MNGYCSPLPNAQGNSRFLPPCSNNAFNLGFNSHIRGFNVEDSFVSSHVFPGKAQLGNESGANGPIYTWNDGMTVIELNKRYNRNGMFIVQSGL